MATGEMFKKELAAYERERERLIGTEEGKYALIHGDSIAGVWSSYEDALKEGYQRFGLSPFFVKQIQRVERVCFFTRDIATCQS